MYLQRIDTMAGAGDSAKAGGDKINANTFALGLRSVRHTPVHCVFDGDSKAGEIKAGLRWMAYFEGLDVRFDGGDLGVGGSNSGTGGSNLLSPARLATMQALLETHSTAGRTVDYFLTIGTNDMSANLSPAGTVANVRKLHNAYLRPHDCFRYLILVSVDPRSSGSETVSRIHTVNRLYGEYARANPFDVLFVDTTGVMLDPALANVAGNPLPFGATTAPMPAGAVTDDGLHCSNHGKYLKRFATLPLRDLYRRKPARNLSRALAISRPNATGANMVGADGRIVAAHGTDRLTNSGTGLVTGLPPTGSTLTGTIDGNAGVDFAPSTVVVTDHGGLVPNGTWPSVRVTLSGTTGTATSALTLSWLATPDAMIALGDVVTAGVLVHFNACTGLLGLDVRANNPAAVSGAQAGAAMVGVSPAAQAIVEPLQGAMLLEGDDAPATSSQNAFFLSLSLYLPSNTALSGSIDLLTIFAERVGPIPPAAD